jgi:hypothetical protein
MFVPSLIYWPSSIGKEARMVLAIGVASYGVARIFIDDRSSSASAAPPGLVGAVDPSSRCAAPRARDRAGIAQSVPQARAGLSRPRHRGPSGRIDGRGCLRDRAASAARDNSAPWRRVRAAMSGAFAPAHRSNRVRGSGLPTDPVRTPLDLPMATILGDPSSVPVGCPQPAGPRVGHRGLERAKSEKRRTHRDETQRSYADDPRGAEPVLAHRDSSGVVS